MNSATLTVTYTNPAAGEALTIEQEPWPESLGVVTARQAMDMMTHYAVNGDAPDGGAGINCVDMPAVINVYPEPPTMAYSFRTSWGSLSGPVIADVEAVEAITVNSLVNADTPSLPGPVQKIIKVDWLLGPFDKGGCKIPQPTYTLEGNQLIFDGPAFYAGLRVRYIRHRHQFKLTIPARQDATENEKQATVFAICSGSIIHHEVTPPPEDGICLDASKYGGSVTIDSPDPGDGAPINKKTERDYCTDEVIRVTIT